MHVGDVQRGTMCMQHRLISFTLCYVAINTHTATTREANVLRAEHQLPHNKEQRENKYKKTETSF